MGYVCAVFFFEDVASLVDPVFSEDLIPDLLPETSTERIVVFFLETQREFSPVCKPGLFGQNISCFHHFPVP